MTENASHELPDVDRDMLFIEIGPDILGSHKGAIAQFDIDKSWCPNVLQLRALRDRCNTILAQHEGVEDQIATLADVRSAFVSAGYVVDSHENLMRCVRGTIGNNRVNELLDEEQGLVEFDVAVAKYVDWRAFEEAAESMSEGVIIDAEGNLCHQNGELIARAEDWTYIPRLKMIAAIINAVVKAPSP